MENPTMVTITVPLTLPLSLVNQIEHESSRVNMSIPEKLSVDLIAAYDERNEFEMAEAARQSLNITPREFPQIFPLAPLAPESSPPLRTPAAGGSALPSAGVTGLTAG